MIALFLVCWAWAAYRPEIPEDWLLENLLVFVLVAVLITSYHWIALSDLSYLSIFVFLCLHECGAHYQYAGALPGEWMKHILHTERNQYDRVVHFTFGLFMSYPQREILIRKARLQGGWTYTLPVLITLALSAAYEIIEAVVASVVDPTDAAAFLGMQGDLWDSQKDMSMDLAGASVAMLCLAAVGAIQRDKLRRAASTVR